MRHKTMPQRSKTSVKTGQLSWRPKFGISFNAAVATMRVSLSRSPLRSAIGKTELSVPLGAERMTALRKLPAAVAGIQDRIDQAPGG